MIEKVSASQFRLHGQLSMRESAGLLQELFGLASASGKDGVGGCLQLDVSALESSDSVLLAAILEIGRRLSRVGCRLQVTGLSDNLSGLARVYGIESLVAAYR